MIDASLPVQKAVRARLIADATVNALVAERIYDTVPVNAVQPYLSFGPFDVLPEAADCSEGVEITLQIDGWASKSVTIAGNPNPIAAAEVSKRLGAAVARSLHWAEMSLDEEQRLVIMQVETVRYLRDPDGITLHSAVSVRALTEPIVILEPIIRLTGSSVPENAVVGAVVGTLSVSGAFEGTPAFTLVDDAGGRFALDGAVVEVAAALDFEAATSHSITVAVGGITPAADDETFTISVTNIDDTPPIITSSPSVSNVEGTTLSHTLTANETITLWEVLSGADSTKVEIVGSTLRWAGNGVKDFEAPDDFDTNNTYIFSIRATDQAGLQTNQVVTITVTNVVETAGDISLSGSTVPENASIGTTVGTLSITGTTGTPVFTLTDSAGGRFSITGSLVKVAAALDFEAAASHSITVAVSGVTPPTTSETFTITVTDVDETAPIISSPSTANNLENTVLAHALTADETVTWTIIGGADAARFEISGSTLRWTGNGTKDFEAPNDANLDNAYIVQVRATNLAGLTATQTITITVTNVAEGSGMVGQPIGLLLALTRAT